MITKQLGIRDFQILGFSGNIDACAQFIYKRFIISFSTMGLSKGACQTEVCIFNGAYYLNQLKPSFHTVEQAINWIDENVKSESKFIEAINSCSGYWLNGKREVITGETAYKAFSNAGYGSNKIEAIDWGY